MARCKKCKTCKGTGDCQLCSGDLGVALVGAFLHTCAFDGSECDDCDGSEGCQECDGTGYVDFEDDDETDDDD